jgi:hypothetical protein
MTLIDELLPRFDARSRYAKLVDAPPEAVLPALGAIEQGDLPVTRALMGLRGLPSLLTKGLVMARSGDRVIEAMLELGFVLLGERKHELALGTVGQFWRPASRPRALADAEAFASFDEPGQAKAVMDFRGLPANGGSVMTTETRILATDAEARRKFLRYWRLISFGSGLIRHEMMSAVARRAEGRSSVSA